MSPDVADHVARQSDEEYDDRVLPYDCEACGDEMSSPWLRVCRWCAEEIADQEAAKAWREGREE